MENSFTDLLVLALVVEVATNFIRNYVPLVKKNSSIPLIAGVLGSLLCVLVGVGVFESIGISLPYAWLDQILTGIVISRGAGLVHDFGKRLAR